MSSPHLIGYPYIRHEQHKEAKAWPFNLICTFGKLSDLLIEMMYEEKVMITDT